MKELEWWDSYCSINLFLTNQEEYILEEGVNFGNPPF